jgi:DNA repair exonuclease SbcCD ATPase subunit
MSKLQELKSRKEELVTKMAQLCDELTEVNEYISAVEKADSGKKTQTEQTINLREIELNFRDAALRRASVLLSETLTSMEEIRPECPNCGENMKKKESEPSR